MSLKEYVEKYPDKNYSRIAHLVPCTPQHISQIASGKKFPSFKMAKRIEQVTNGKVKSTNWYQL